MVDPDLARGEALVRSLAVGGGRPPPEGDEKGRYPSESSWVTTSLGSVLWTRGRRGDCGVVKITISAPAGSRSRPAQPSPFHEYDPGSRRRPAADATGPAPSIRNARARDSSDWKASQTGARGRWKRISVRAPRCDRTPRPASPKLRRDGAGPRPRAETTIGRPSSSGALGKRTMSASGKPEAR